MYNINVICAYGGGSKYEQSNELQNEGAELVVCTPVRIFIFNFLLKNQEFSFINLLRDIFLKKIYEKLFRNCENSPEKSIILF